MDDILKYQRIEGALSDIFAREKVTAANLESDHIILGTESGVLHIINFSGQVVKSARLHKRAINSISVDLDGELTILSGADNGAAVVLTLGQDDFKENTYPFSEPLKAVCLEPSGNSTAGAEQNTLSRGGEKAFLVGTSSGRLILQRPSGWFRQSQKEVVLFPGAGSAVTTITWERNLVAWADASQVRVMDIATQTALCQMSAPVGVGPEEAYPCSLCWLTPRDLLIGWADNFRHVRLSASVAGGQDGADADSGGRVASILCEWTTDCFIAGLHGFDEEHVVYLGYTPPFEDELSELEDEETLAAEGEHPSNQPELIVAKRKSGETVSADQLPLRGFNLSGPEGYILLSSYQCKRNKGDANKWQLRNFQSQRGGTRGYAPTFFVASPQDMVVARVRDVNDRVGHALAQKDLKRAVDIARVDKNALTLYKFADLLKLYLTHLLELREAATAASECRRLIGEDAAMWEFWIHRFIDHKQLDSIAAIIPTERPTLASTVYEAVLLSLLNDSPRVFLDTVKRWGRCSPPLFDHQSLLRTLEQQKAGDRVQGSSSYYIEAQAQLYIIAHMYEKAVNCYLDTRIAERLAATANSGAAAATGTPAYKTDKEDSKVADFRFVFDLIERQNLFRTISNKVINLVRLSKPLSAKLLLAHIDKLPIRSVAQQLSSDRKLFLWYLHLLFTDPAAREQYSDELEYADLHARQVQLYAELMPKAPPSPHASSSGSVKSKSQLLVQRNVAVGEQDGTVPEQVLLKRVSPPDSDLLVFLKSGLAPLDLALTECEKQSPPLYAEMIYIHAQMGNQRKALHLHLAEIGDVGLAIDFIESQLDTYIGSKRRYGHKLPAASSAAAAESNDPALHTSHYVECQLWDDLVDYCLSHTAFLMRVLDYLGMCRLNPAVVISKIPDRAYIPYLRLRLIRLLDQIKFQTEISVRTTALQEVDALNLLRQQNQGQRRAMKVDTVVRCAACSRPLAMPAGSAMVKGGPLHMQLLEMTHSSSGAVQVWGPKPSAGGVAAAVTAHSSLHVTGEFTAFLETQYGETSASNTRSAPAQSAAAAAAAAAAADDAAADENSVTGTVIFSNKLAFHRLCYQRMHC